MGVYWKSFVEVGFLHGMDQEDYDLYFFCEVQYFIIWKESWYCCPWERLETRGSPFPLSFYYCLRSWRVSSSQEVVPFLLIASLLMMLFSLLKLMLRITWFLKECWIGIVVRRVNWWILINLVCFSLLTLLVILDWSCVGSWESLKWVIQAIVLVYLCFGEGQSVKLLTLLKVRCWKKFRVENKAPWHKLVVRFSSRLLPMQSLCTPLHASSFLKRFCISFDSMLAKFWWGQKGNEGKVHWKAWSKLKCY